jgi:hypothetical protein
MPGGERGIQIRGGAEEWKAAGWEGTKRRKNEGMKKRQDEEKAPWGLGTGGAWTETGPSAVQG